MNFKLTHGLPEKCIVAVSGGVDSLSALHFLNRVEGRVERVIHVNHATGVFAQDAEALVREVCERDEINLTVRRIREHRGEGESRENHWRDQRYRFFWDENARYNLPIVLGHNMDDCLEEYIICTMIRGYWGTIPYRHGCCIRPFRMWKRRDIELYASRYDIKWLEDPTNSDDARFLRAKVRRRVAPRIKNLNPGVYSVLENAINHQDEYDEDPQTPGNAGISPPTDPHLILSTPKSSNDPRKKIEG